MTLAPTTRRRRLTLVIHSLDGGGAERTVARMANHWAEEGHQVTLVTLDSAARDRYPPSAAVRRRALDLMGRSSNPLAAAANNLRRIRRLRAAIAASEPEAVVSMTDKTNVLTLAACWRMNVPVIVAERTDPRHHKIGPSWSFLRKRLYPRAAALVVQTRGVREAVRGMAAGRPVYVIPNAVARPGEASIRAATAGGDRPGSPGSFAPGRKRILAAGRLTAEKGFDRLLRAFAQAASRHPEWDLVILGEGPERRPLELLAEQLQLAGRVAMPGWCDDVAAAMARCDLFVLSSLYEGFPNALAEAMAAGMPVVSYDCQSGPAEIIRDGYDGLLVRSGSVEWLAAAIDRLMGDEAGRRLLAGHAREVVERFSEARFYQRWEAVLDGAGEDDAVFATPEGDALCGA
ncbi:MAG: glycosyltransferase family 4 protein [Thermoguttaceae bacterium]|jgi:GalNAc-alpha-(1->4)-GalNAc-alpha-(1->3)-diNAcBac-PP-undecaprenol alpha-1,4-N-acetyl-D-galactosaminyltransferase